MYSPSVVDRTLHNLAKKGEQFKRRTLDESLTITDKLSKLFVDGKLTRDFTESERAFIRSETLVCRADFRYWSERYGFAEMDASEGGGIGPAKFWPSQERALKLIADREEENYQELQKHGFTQGIRICYHKTRQQGATALMCLLKGHRMSLYKHTRALSVSLDETKILELYKRDHIWLDNLPFFLKPKLEFDVKGHQLSFETLKSGLTYQQANQQAGIGTGQQFDFSQLTEVALYPNPERLEFDFMPAIPQSFYTFTGWESTANGRGNFWHEFTENVRHKRYGFTTWVYAFTPWYINSNKNRLIAPDDWTPNETTQQHAELIERTSAEFAGTTIRPGKNNLYWWEVEYSKNKAMGSLAVFLSNYPATPEQSFQHNAQSALPLDTVEWMRTTSMLGMTYEYGYKENRTI